MAHVLFGCSSADLALTQGGITAPGAGPFSVFTTGPDRATSVAVTDLKDLADNATTSVTFDADGFLRFKAPDTYPVLWLDTGVGLRVAVRPVNLTGPKGDKGDKGDTGSAGPAIGALLTTKGDLAVHNGTTAVREPVGSDGQVLLADSTQAEGLRWGQVTPVGVAGAFTAPASNVTLTAADSVVAVDTTAGARTITLPLASTMTGRILRVIKTGGANTLTVQRQGSDLLTPGGKTSVAFPSDCAMGEIEVASSGTGWRVVSGQASDESVGSRRYEWSQALAASGTGATVGWSLVGGHITDGLTAPEGAVAAPPGTLWTQINSTTALGGILVWRKRTGTGTTGWVVVEGDTGWYNIASLCNAAAFATLHKAQMRRVGPQVFIMVRGSLAGGLGAAADFIPVIPAGFVPAEYATYATIWPGAVPVLINNSSTQSQMRFTRATATDIAAGAVGVAFSYATDQPWPSSAPV